MNQFTEDVRQRFLNEEDLQNLLEEWKEDIIPSLVEDGIDPYNNSSGIDDAIHKLADTWKEYLEEQLFPDDNDYSLKMELLRSAFEEIDFYNLSFAEVHEYMRYNY